MTATAQTQTDWAAFYGKLLKDVQIPATAGQDFGRTQIIVRDLLLNLGDVYATARQQGSQAHVVSVYADVLRISGSVAPFVSGTGLLLAARRIEVDPGSSILLDYRSSQAGKLIVYSQEIAGQLQAKAVTPSNGSAQATMLDLSHPETVGVMVSYTETAPTTRALATFDDSGLALGSPMRMSLNSIFQIATTVFYSQPDLARSMLSWIMAVTNGSQVAHDLYLQSSAVLAQLNVSTSSVTFVPYLDKDVYANVAQSFIPAAAAYEQQYQRYGDKQQTVDDRKAAATLMLQHYQDTSKLNQQLITQAEANLASAEHALDQAGVTLRVQQSKAQDAGIGFKYDSKIWVRDQIMKAVLSMATALVEFAASIGLMAIGDEAGGAQAGAAVAQGAEAASTASGVAKQVQEVSTFAKTMNDVSEAMKKLKDVGETLGTMYTSVTQIVAAAQDISSAVVVTDVTIPYVDDISAQAEWDAFRLGTDALLKPAIDQKIPGALEYQVELDKLAIYGKAYMADQVAVVKAGQDVAQLYLQKQVSVNQEDRLQQYIAQLSTASAFDDAMTQSFFERELNIKRWLFVAIQNYTWAYRYWALRDSRVQLSIVKPVADLQADLGTVTQEYADALQSFNPPPQTFPAITIVIPDTTEGLYKDVIANLRQGRSTSFPIELGNPAFNGLGRVRLTRIRVWLEGVKASSEQPLYIDITNSGVYSDRLKDTTYRFASSAFGRVFEYKGSPGDASNIIVDGEVAEREAYAYFQPTPFTEWTITVPEQNNAGPDLSTLTAITLDLAGTTNATLDLLHKAQAVSFVAQ